MIAGETSRGSNGYQNLLFPLAYMYISQGESGSYSHRGTLVLDLIGWDANGRVLRCPYYAPCDLKLVAKYGSNSPELVWESIDKVNFIDGTLDYVTIGVAHDNDIPSFTIGETRTQGQIMGKTGTYGNVTGDHVHMEIAKGKYAGHYRNSYGNYMLKNSYHMYYGMGVNDTVLYKPLTYPWREFSDQPIPPRPHPPYPDINKKFPWFIYRNKKVNRKRKNLTNYMSSV